MNDQFDVGVDLIARGVEPETNARHGPYLGRPATVRPSGGGAAQQSSRAMPQVSGRGAAEPAAGGRVRNSHRRSEIRSPIATSGCLGLIRCNSAVTILSGSLSKEDDNGHGQLNRTLGVLGDVHEPVHPLVGPQASHPTIPRCRSCRPAQELSQAGMRRISSRSSRKSAAVW
jgi:hypothetical protein